ncbi:MAG: thioredoxin [Planctomycetaceae bacterium]|jgi:thioredoxin 1|nr:thioredoxin [Planctomycetaceae bacterium]
MSDSIQILETEADFAAATASGIVIVDFFATWCRPCRMQLSILETLASDLAGKAKIVKVDTDKLKDVAEKWGIQSIPTLFLLKDGQRVQQFVGVQQADILRSAVDQALK